VGVSRKKRLGTALKIEGLTDKFLGKRKSMTERRTRERPLTGVKIEKESIPRYKTDKENRSGIHGLSCCKTENRDMRSLSGVEEKGKAKQGRRPNLLPDICGERGGKRK